MTYREEERKRNVVGNLGNHEIELLLWSALNVGPANRQRGGAKGIRRQGLTAHMAARLIDSSTRDTPSLKRNGAAGHLSYPF